MSFEVYKILHLLGIFSMLVITGGVIQMVRSGIEDEPASTKRNRMIIHGVAMFLILVAGFGMLARLGLSNPMNWPLWVWIKVLVWIYMGGVQSLIRRFPGHINLWLYSTVIIALLAGIMAITKPLL